MEEYIVKGIRMVYVRGEDNLDVEHTESEEISITRHYQASSQVVLALVTATASKMLESYNTVQILYGGSVCYEMKRI